MKSAPPFPRMFNFVAEDDSYLLGTWRFTLAEAARDAESYREAHPGRDLAVIATETWLCPAPPVEPFYRWFDTKE